MGVGEKRARYVGRIVGRQQKEKVKTEEKRLEERKMRRKSKMNHWRLIHPFGAIVID